MLAVKAKHATMLLTVSDVEGLPEGLQEIDEEKSKKSSAQSVMVRKLLQAANIFTPLTVMALSFTALKSVSIELC